MTGQQPSARPKRWPIIAAAAGAVVVLVLAGVGVASGLTGGFGGAIAPVASGGAPGTGAPETSAGGYGVTAGGGSVTGGSGTGSSPGQDDDGLAAAPAPRPTEEPEPETWAPTVVILDASGSMVRDAPGGGTRMEAARKATVALVQGLGSDAVLGLTVFGTGTGNSPAEQAAGCTDITVKVPVGPVDQDAFVAAINSIRQSGYTPLGPAMRNAAAQLGDGRATIVLVSDGVDTCAPPPSCDVASELRAANPELTIQAIGFNVDADEEAQEALRCIAQVGGGEYFSAGNAAQLAAKLRLASDPTATHDAVTSSGYNALRLGMSYDAARNADPSIEDADVTVHIVYVHCDTAVLEFTDGVLTAIRPRDDSPTAEGVAPGATVASAIELYGQPTDQGSDSDGDYLVFATDDYGVTGYRVYVDGNRILWIVVCICGPHSDRAILDYSTWEVGFGVIGPLEVGMSFGEVYDAIGDRTPHTPDFGWECPYRQMADYGTGSQISVFGSFDPDDGYASVEVVSEIMFSGSSSSGSILPRTAQGIGIGSTRSELEQAHPSLSYVLGYWNVDYGIVTARNGYSMIVMFDDADRVTYVQVGEWLSPPYELCV